MKKLMSYGAFPRIAMLWGCSPLVCLGSVPKPPT